jgi:hypothetical protein
VLFTFWRVVGVSLDDVAILITFSYLLRDGRALAEGRRTVELICSYLFIIYSGDMGVRPWVSHMSALGVVNVRPRPDMGVRPTSDMGVRPWLEFKERIDSPSDVNNVFIRPS